MKLIKKILYVIMILVLILGGVCYNRYWVSYHTVEVTTVNFESDKIDKPVHFAVIADVHDEHCLVKDKIIKKIKELNPDAILCVGDIIDKSSNDDISTIKFLSSLVKVAPVYMSYGNHEDDYYKRNHDQLSHITECGVTLMEEIYTDIIINNQKIRLGGMYNYAFETGNGTIDEKWFGESPTYKFLMDYTNTELFTLMMAHRPDTFILHHGGEWPIDLAVSGHIHGGQVIIPFIGGLYAPEQGKFPKYCYGLYQLTNMQLLITRGCADTGEKIPRFNNPPEIIDLYLN